MASLRRHGAGWEIRWREGGKARSCVVRGSKREALDRQAAVERELRLAAEVPAGAVIPWAELVERWAVHLYQQGRGVRYCAESARQLTHHTSGWRTVASATPPALDALPLGTWRLAKACLRWAAIYHCQPVDRAALGRPRPSRRRTPAPDLLTAEQVALLIAAADAIHPAHGTLAHLVATYGHRPESLIRLEGQAFDGGSLTLPVKGGDTIRHPLLQASIERIQALAPQRGRRLFIGHLGRPWREGRELTSWWYHRVGERVMPSHPGIYHLKRYAISRMLGAGLDLATVASITGHRTPSILLRYARTNEQRQTAALAVLAGGSFSAHTLPTNEATPGNAGGSLRLEMGQCPPSTG